MTKEQILNCIGTFTWNFAYQWYVKTEIGNFVYDASRSYFTYDLLFQTEIAIDEWYRFHDIEIIDIEVSKNSPESGKFKICDKINSNTLILYMG